jgi:hypothetical protein
MPGDRRIEPSEKSLPVGMFLEERYGRTSAINDGKCVPEPVGCGRQLTQEEVEEWDRLTLKEYTISGMCKDCQDKFFGSDEPEEPQFYESLGGSDEPDYGDASYGYGYDDSPMYYPSGGAGEIGGRGIETHELPSSDDSGPTAITDGR